MFICMLKCIFDAIPILDCHSNCGSGASWLPVLIDHVSNPVRSGSVLGSMEWTPIMPILPIQMSFFFLSIGDHTIDYAKPLMYLQRVMILHARIYIYHGWNERPITCVASFAPHRIWAIPLKIISIFISMFEFVSISISLCVSLSLSIHSSNISIHPAIFHINLSIYPSIYLSIHPFIYLFTYLFVYLYIYVYICLYLSLSFSMYLHICA